MDVKNTAVKNHSPIRRHTEECTQANANAQFKIDRVIFEDCERCMADVRKPSAADTVVDVLIGVVFGLGKVFQAALSLALIMGIIYLIATFVFGWSGQVDLSLPMPEVTINDTQ